MVSEYKKQNIKKRYKSEYAIWIGMIGRCTNPRSKSFPNYGGRGITVCSSWLESFEAFLRDVGPRPSREYSLDRINVNGNYKKANCRWATKRQQAVNRRPRNEEATSLKSIIGPAMLHDFRQACLNNGELYPLVLLEMIENYLENNRVAVHIIDEEIQEKPPFAPRNLSLINKSK